ncbi:MAG TPA: aldehyde dehydrogenase [Micropepsaceae bacterium]|nr:aldehyde dehydrogenase [Micropepsaceae bacterium]
MAMRNYDRLYIGGEWVTPHSGRVISSIDPSTEDVWAEVAEADDADVNRAVAAAKHAMAGPWQTKISASQRGALLFKLAELVRRDAARLAELESRDNGKPLRDTVGEVQRAVDWLVFFAGAADKIQGEQIPFKPGALAYTRREPVGVVGAILPWNSPILLYSWKIGPALAAGNALVVKPAEQTPVTALEIAKLVEEAGFPAGVFNVVPGFGATAGAALVAHRGVNKISLTGSHATARRIMGLAADTLKRCTFECGGKSPHIVFADADVERALVVATQSAFRSTGQSCSLGSRVFVQRPLYESFLAKLAERAQRIRIGMPLDKATHIGPQTSADQLAKTQSYIDIGKQEGARLVTGGARPKGFERGYFIEPTVFADVDNRSRLAQEEIFGPVIAVMPFDTEEEVVRLANDVEYGLVAGLWTSDVGRAHRVAGQIEAGLVTVNTFRTTHPMLPYGGYKLSGLGRENGMEALHHFTEVKTVVVDFDSAPPADPFAD